MSHNAHTIDLPKETTSVKIVHVDNNYIVSVHVSLCAYYTPHATGVMASSTSLKVVTLNDKFGFSVPCTLNSLEELILRYKEHSLEQHNHGLTTTLKYPP